MSQLIDASIQPLRTGIAAVFHESSSFLYDLLNGIVETQFAFKSLLLSIQSIALVLGSGNNLFVDTVDFCLHLRDARLVTGLPLRRALNRVGIGRASFLGSAEGSGFSPGRLKCQLYNLRCKVFFTVLVNNIAGRAADLQFGRGFAIQLNDRIQMIDDCFTVQRLLLLGEAA